MKAPAASQSRSGAHHSAVSSGDGTSTHADSPRVVEHAIAGDLFIAQVRFLDAADALEMLHCIRRNSSD